MDRRDLPSGKSNSLDLKPCERLRDRDHLRRAECQDALDEAKRSGSERIVVVLRRHEPDRGERSIDVRMHEVCVHQVGPRATRRTCYPVSKQRVDVTRCCQPLVGHGELLVERIRRAARVIESQELCLDATFGQRR